MNPPIYPGQYTGPEFLSEVMKQLDVDIKELGLAAGVQDTIIQRILDGKLKLLPGYTESIFKALGLRVVLLVEEEEPGNEESPTEGDWTG